MIPCKKKVEKVTFRGGLGSKQSEEEAGVLVILKRRVKKGGLYLLNEEKF